MKICLLLAVLAYPVFAQSTEEIISACQKLDGKVENASENQATLPSTFAAGLCWGAFMLPGLSAHSETFHFCMPQGVTKTQAIAVFLAFCRRNPQRLHEPFEKVVVDALREAFPCQAQRSP